MRAFSLLGLRADDGSALRFRPTNDGPLVVPCWFPGTDREQILDFYQLVLAEAPMPRIEVEWDGQLLEVDANFLRTVRERRGSAACLVVVRVLRAGTDLNEILARPEIAAFQFVAVAGEHPLQNERFGTLTDLVRLVVDAALSAYDSLCQDFPLDANAPKLIDPFIDSLLNPVVVLDAFNSVVDIQGEVLAPEQRAEALKIRVIGGLLDAVPDQLAIGLVAIAEQGKNGLANALRKKALREQMTVDLRARMLLRDGNLVRWARFLSEPGFRDRRKSRLERIRVSLQDKPQGLSIVLKWMETSATENTGSFRLDVLTAFGHINEGRLEKASAQLTELEAQAVESIVGPEALGDFWDAVGRLRMAEDQWIQAEPAFRRSLELLARNATPTSRGITMDALARGLRYNDRWPEAEPLFREALRLEEKGKAPPTTRGMTMHELACGLRDNGRWPEAEPLFREALRLKEEGKDTPTSRGFTMDELARGLRDNGRWPEAEALANESARLRTQSF
jgi:tetratricopeptide (TPR) repeat protein